jgi:hypothetical protein
MAGRGLRWQARLLPRRQLYVGGVSAVAKPPALRLVDRPSAFSPDTRSLPDWSGRSRNVLVQVRNESL